VDSEIIKYINNCLKAHVKEQSKEKNMSAKEKKNYQIEIEAKFEPINWLGRTFETVPNKWNNFCDLSAKNFTLLEILALPIGYRRNFKTAIEDEFEYLCQHFKKLTPDILSLWKKRTEPIPSEIVNIFSFFQDEIKRGKSEDSINKHICKKIAEISLKAKNGCIVSHASKFSHPDARYPKIYKKKKKNNDGFIRTGNSGSEFDLHINAADLQVFKFLELKIDSRTILQIFQDERAPSKIADFFNLPIKKVENWKKLFLAVTENDDYRTDRLIKQVYFPIGNSSYHQLSILTPSPIVFQIKNKLDYINSNSKRAYTGKLCKKDNIEHDGYESIFDITVQRHGGEHPKNISGLNNKYQNVYLLASVPPNLKPEKTKLPTWDFFRNCLWAKQFNESFEALHKLLIADVNNSGIRQGRDKILLHIYDRIVGKIWQIRSHDSGWSERERFKRLPKYQKVVLDNHWEKERQEKKEFLEEFTGTIGRWIINAYKDAVGKKAFLLNDDEIKHVKKLINNQREVLL